MSILSRILVPCLAGILIVGSLGCGGSSNNDQGTSFMAIGWFDSASGGTGVSGVYWPLGSDGTGLVNLVDGSLAAVGGDGQNVPTYIGLENRLAAQFIRVVRMDCTYDVPGADANLAIPSDSQALGGVIPGGSITLPSLDSQQQGAVEGSKAYFGVNVVSPDIFAYLNANRNYLPELPFRMIATCTATGVTQAGDVLTTNELNFPVQFMDPTECCGSPEDFQNGPGTGGDLSGSTSEETTEG